MKVANKMTANARLQKGGALDKGTKIKSEPVSARSRAAWPVGTSTSPSQPAYNSAASVTVSSLGMGSAVSSDASGSEPNAKVSPHAPLV